MLGAFLTIFFDKLLKISTINCYDENFKILFMTIVLCEKNFAVRL